MRSEGTEYRLRRVHCGNRSEMRAKHCAPKALRASKATRWQRLSNFGSLNVFPALPGRGLLLRHRSRRRSTVTEGTTARDDSHTKCSNGIASLRTLFDSKD